MLMTRVDDTCTLSFPKAKNVVISGDIHGDFNQLVHKLCVQYAMRDTLLTDVEAERNTMTDLYNRLVHDAHPLSHWFYGHFHQSWHNSIEGVLFTMLDIMEFREVY